MECDGCQKEENSIALEHSRQRAFIMWIRSIPVSAEERSCLEGVYSVRR